MLNRIAFAQATLSVMQATRGSLVIDVRRFVVGCRLCQGPPNSDWKLTGNIDAATLVDVFFISRDNHVSAVHRRGPLQQIHQTRQSPYP